jgi:hypothetical protein
MKRLWLAEPGGTPFPRRQGIRRRSGFGRSAAAGTSHPSSSRRCRDYAAAPLSPLTYEYEARARAFLGEH